MSTWISKSALCVATLALTACSSDVGVRLSSAGQLFAKPAPTEITVGSSGLLISAPPGYCIDTRSTTETASGAFVLLAECGPLKRTRGLEKTDQLLTATVLNSDLAEDVMVEDLEAYFDTDAGRKALSRTGDADSVEVLEIRAVNGALFVHARDVGSALTPDLASDYWRGLMAIDRRLVTVSLVGPSDNGGETTSDWDTLNSFAQTILTQNAGVNSEL